MNDHHREPPTSGSPPPEVAFNLLDLAADPRGEGPPHALGRQLPAMVARFLMAAGIEARHGSSTLELEGRDEAPEGGRAWAVPAGELDPGKAIELSRRLGPARFLAYGELGPERHDGMSLRIRVLRRGDADEVLTISRRFFAEEVGEVVRIVARSLAALVDRQEMLDRLDPSEALGSSRSAALLRLSEGLDALAASEARLAGSDLERSVALLLEALEKDPGCTVARDHALATLARETDRGLTSEQGIALGLRFSELTGDDDEVSVLLARLFQRAGRLDEAESALRRVATDEPAGLVAVELARLHQARGELQRALELTSRALADESAGLSLSTRAEALELHGLGLARTGRLDDALAPLEEAASLTPENGRLWTNLGRCHHLSGHLREALDAYQRGAELLPRSWEAARNLASLLLDLGQGARARDLLESWVRERPELPEPALALAEMLIGRSDELARVQEILEEAAARSPDDPRLQALLGGVFVGLDDHEAAAAHYRRALELDPDDPALMSNLALVLSHQGRLTEAEPLARRAVEIAPHDLLCLQVLDHLRRRN